MIHFQAVESLWAYAGSLSWMCPVIVNSSSIEVDGSAAATTMSQGSIEVAVPFDIVLRGDTPCSFLSPRESAVVFGKDEMTAEITVSTCEPCPCKIGLSSNLTTTSADAAAVDR